MLGKRSGEKRRDNAQSGYQNTISDNALCKKWLKNWVFA
jgi:hypothetical protein